MIVDFFAVLAALKAKLEGAASAVQAAAAAQYRRPVEIHLGKTPADVPGVTPSVLLIDGDEAPVYDGPDAGPANRDRALREVMAVIVQAREANHIESLNALQTALVADLHRKPLAGALRVLYVGGGSDYETTKNVAMRSVTFEVLYDRGVPDADPSVDLRTLGLDYRLKPGDDVADATDLVTLGT